MKTKQHRDENGLLHNTNGPALIDEHGNQFYFIHGKRHRDNGPAVIYKNGKYKGIKAYYKNGKMHREDGPAFIDSERNYNGFYLEGKFYKRFQFYINSLIQDLKKLAFFFNSL